MLHNPNITYTRTYTISRPDGSLLLETKDKEEADQFLQGYKEVPPYGSDRAKALAEYEASKDQLEYVSSGSYASQITYVMNYYK